MKRFGTGWIRRTVAASMVVLAGAAVGGCAATDSGGGGEGGAKELRFAYFASEQSPFGQLWSWWMDEVERRTDGELTFEPYWDASLLKGPEMLDGLKDGRVDVAQVTPPMYPGKFPLTSVTELPFVSENVPAGAKAITDMSAEDEALQAEWSKQGVKAMAWNIASPGALGTSQPLDSPADLDGRKIRGIDRSSQVLGRAGANLVNLDLSEIYGGMERGLINGFFGIPFGFIGSLKLPEVAKHYTNVGMGITTANALSMSTEGWEGLSPEQQQVIEDVSAEIPAKLAEFDGAAEDGSCEAVQDEGAKLSAFSPDEVEQLRSGGRADESVQTWADEVEKAGADVDPMAFYEQWSSTTKAAEGEFSDYVTGMTRCMDGAGGQ